MKLFKDSTKVSSKESSRKSIRESFKNLSSDSSDISENRDCFINFFKDCFRVSFSCFTSFFAQTSSDSLQYYSMDTFQDTSKDPFQKIFHVFFSIISLGAFVGNLPCFFLRNSSRVCFRKFYKGFPTTSSINLRNSLHCFINSIEDPFRIFFWCSVW